MPRLRLVKVIVQPVLVLDDGENMIEVDHPPVAIPADEWPTYSSERFPRELREWQARIDAQAAEGDPNATMRESAEFRA
jgi:hypothetical protein